jgi:ABC-type transport system involved in cytochrome c biogenesis permease subunit
MSAPTVSHDYVGDQPPPKTATRTRPTLAYRVLLAIASLRITVVLFALSMALVFFGTLGMTLDSIEDAKNKYFRCWGAWIDLQGLAEFGKVFLHLSPDASLHVKIPFPGGYTIGWVMFFNLLAAHLVRFKLTWKRSGIVLLHAGVIVLLAGEFLTGQMSVETRMMIKEGDTGRWAFSLTDHELAVIDPSDPAADHVVVVPGRMLTDARKGEWVSHPDLPFDFQVKEHFANSTLKDLEPGDAPEADRGMGRRMALTELPKVKGTDSDGKVNYPAAYLALRTKDGQSLGTYLFTTMLERKQEVKVGDKAYQVAYRFQRTYKPYEVHVLKAEHDKYAGTEIAKDYASTVVVKDPEFGEQGPIRIWMNHPLMLYKRGETFYQSTMNTDPDGTKTTGFQVVSNPAWTFPYFACGMVALGMAFHFLVRLIGFLPKTAASKAAATADAPANRFERYFPLGIAALAGLMLVGKLMTPSAKLGKFDFYGFGQIPVQHNGRVQPLDSVARNTLMVISGKQEVVDESNHDRVYPAIEWLLHVWGKPDDADKFKIFRADHPQLLSLMELPQRPGFYRYSWDELMPGRDKLEQQADLARRKDKEKRDVYDQRVLQLYEHMTLYVTLRARAAPGVIPADDPNAKWISIWDLHQAFQKDRAAEFQQKADDEVDRQFADPAVRARLVQARQQMGDERIARFIQMEKDQRRRELATGAFFQELSNQPSAAGAVQKAVDAFRADKPADFNAAVAEHKEKYTSGVPDSAKSRVGLEARMNFFDPFLQCMVLYLGVAILAALSWLVWPQSLRRAAFLLAAVTLVVHTVALVSRMYIGNRPPVTNLYSSAVFIGWGGLVLCLFLEWFYRLGVGTFAGGLLGFSTLLIARFLSESGDTLEMLQAVLDTNFWLATHVTTVTMGYMTTLVAGVIAIAYILGGVFTNALRGETGRKVAGMIYGTLCFATLLSFTGTVLGGIWADQSWGRFWGWDPKENGAVLIVIWNALILHARWGGLVKSRGVAVLAVIGCIWTVWSWFGTNQLGIGLHAYGFDSRLANACALSWVALGLIAALGMVPLKYWASFGPPPAKAATV